MTSWMFWLYVAGFISALVFLYDTLLPLKPATDIQGLILLIRGAALAVAALAMTLGGVMAHMGTSRNSHGMARFGRYTMILGAMLLICMALWSLHGRYRFTLLKSYPSLETSVLSAKAFENRDIAAIHELGRRKDAKAVKILSDIAAREDYHLSLRIAAISSLGSIGDSTSRDSLDELIKSLEGAGKTANDKNSGTENSDGKSAINRDYLLRECRQAIEKITHN
ncbi:MAG: hypothetical protein CVV64_12935 [Candidatus Wallbacteria bacterium HGW-Wallbacteria-1]|jgi:hypothetical protein|uniref:HEAT repeat domain-containing protein n=1 Tax=Candidatus Wallbacteria bacterium HGW-Wallbacteria-1 TaxID=2013854 RepID=A0A2N1PMX7_9BACT|nr:MAG: hypothetical protein CVV64_12935 [Candidatus Wallbacteria bacterium HGW-Wallbacteria-1]